MPDDGRDAYCDSDTGAFPCLGSPILPSVFFISCVNSSGLSVSERVFLLDPPPESCCQTCFIIVSRALFQTDWTGGGENFSGNTEYIS